MHEPITTLFFSQSTEVERMIHEEESNDDEIMVSFVDLEFDLEEENVPDNLTMSAVHSKSFDYEIQKLRGVAKERHDIFFEQVKKVKESVDLKVVNLKSEMSKEVQKMEQNYTFLHRKVDVITTTITKLVALNTEHSNKLEAKSKKRFSSV
ncbi:unnamed protein product [Lactuca virosa]|uniref:Uncharacterized protein n=1 Tax=Lactuca virosa TaxID=75947 RepID=A0AAU9NSY9_9ASTR|nr:unnamed protein product [Lactuca virosa]